MHLLKITESEIETIHPISYILIFDNREHKKNWHVELSGDQQAILSDLSGNPLTFETESAADEYCHSKWSSLHKIKHIVAIKQQMIGAAFEKRQ